MKKKNKMKENQKSTSSMFQRMKKIRRAATTLSHMIQITSWKLKSK
jgi:hypothetical protein